MTAIVFVLRVQRRHRLLFFRFPKKKKTSLFGVVVVVQRNILIRPDILSIIRFSLSRSDLDYGNGMKKWKKKSFVAIAALHLDSFV